MKVSKGVAITILTLISDGDSEIADKVKVHNRVIRLMLLGSLTLAEKVELKELYTSIASSPKLTEFQRITLSEWGVRNLAV